MTSRSRAFALAALAVLYWAVPNARLDFTRFNCHDSESYLALSYSLSHGRGYTRSLPPADYVPHKMWPPGLPLLLTPATVFADGALDWVRVKRTMAILGISGLIPLWLWVRRLAGARAADVAALAVGLSPFYWHFSHQAMTELPLFVWVVGGLWLIDRGWSRPRVSTLEAALLGLGLGLGLLIKAHVASLALAPLAYLGSGGARARRSNAISWVVFCVALALPFSLWLARSQAVDAPGPDGYSQLEQLRMADPMDPDSEVRNAGGAIGSMLANLRSYAVYRIPEQVLPGLWPPTVFAWRGSGWPALALTLLIVGAALGRRPGVRAALMVVAFLGALNLIYGFGGSPRFWVPVSLLLLALMSIRVTAALEGLAPRARRLVAAVAIVALGVNLGAYMTAHERQPYNPHGPWAELAELFARAGESGLESRGVLTPNPHALQLWTGLPAPMTVPGSTFEHMVARLDGVGPQPPAGSVLILAAEPWGLYELPAPAPGRELVDDPPGYPMSW